MIVIRRWLAAVAFAAAALLAPCRATAAPIEPVVAEAFDLAMADLSQARPEQAIPLLRGILGRDPGLVRVRLELARAYFEAGDYGSAREQFGIVLSARSLPGAVRETVLAYLRQIDEARGLRSMLGFSVIAPSGAGRSYETDTVMLDLFGTHLPFELQRAQVPDRALRAEGSLHRQWRLGEIPGGTATAAFLRGTGALQQAEGTDYDRVELEAGGGIRLTWPRSTFTAETFVGRTLVAGALQEQRRGLGGRLERRTGAGLAFSVEGEVAEVDYHDAAERDGTLSEGRIVLSRSFAARGVLSLGLAVEGYAAAREDFGYGSVEVRLTHRLDIRGGISLTSSAAFEVYEQEAATPGFAERRSETERSLDLRIEKNDLFIAGRFTPYLDLSLARRESSVAAYSYRETGLGVGLASAF